MANTEAISKWTQELRSGNRVQGTDRLDYIDGNGVRRQCCLGVFCDLFAEELGLEITKDSYTTQYNGSSHVLPQAAAEYLDVPHPYFTDMVQENPEIFLPLTDEQKEQVLQDGKDHRFELAVLNDSGLTFEQIADVIDYFFA